MLGWAVVAVLLVACDPPDHQSVEPLRIRVSVRGSELLGEYANPPVWVWSVDGGTGVARQQVSLDGTPFQTLSASVRSFRPPQPLAPGSHRLTVRVTGAAGSAATVEDSAEARVDALPGPTPVPYDPCYPAGADPLRCGVAGAGQWPLPQIRLPELWQVLAAGKVRALEPVVVAVLDTGYVPHPDLVDNLDAAAGYDFVSDPADADGDGIDPDATDPGTDGIWHGTAIAGVIAAHTDNGAGVAGMGWPWGSSRITIMPVRVVGRGGATTYDVAQGLLYAAGLENDAGVLPERPARIINVSLAEEFFGPPDEVLEDALRRVTAAGAVVVAAAGNHRSAVRSPANSPHTVAVGSVTADRELAARSNFGPEIDVVAPGGDAAREIPALCADGQGGAARWIVRPTHGTSIAAAHVSGVLALLAGFDRSLTLSDARAILADAAVDLGPPGRDLRYGPGLIDAYAVVGAYPRHRAARVERFARRGAGGVRPATTGAARPGRADPHSLIVRLRDRAESERVRARHAVAGVEAGAGGYALVRLHRGQSRERMRAQLRSDPEVAAVYDNRIYRPAVAPAE